MTEDNKDTPDSLAIGQRRRDRLDSFINYAGSRKRKAETHSEQKFDEIATIATPKEEN